MEEQLYLILNYTKFIVLFFPVVPAFLSGGGVMGIGVESEGTWGHHMHLSVGKTQGQVYQAKTCISSVTLVSSCGLIYISWADDQWGQNGIICGWLI